MRPRLLMSYPEVFRIGRNRFSELVRVVFYASSLSPKERDEEGLRPVCRRPRYPRVSCGTLLDRATYRKLGFAAPKTGAPVEVGGRFALAAIVTSGESPAGAVLPFYKLLCLRTIFCLHLWSVPLDFLACAQGYAAQQHDLCEARRDVKT